MFSVTQDQIDQFNEDGVLVVDRLIDDDTVERLRTCYERLFRGEFETGVTPDEVNWQEGAGDPSLTRQICNGWKADRDIADVVLREDLGRAIAEAFAEAGAAVALLDVNGERAEVAADEVRASTGAATCAVTADVAVKDQVAGAIEGAARELGEIDILINNAGIWRHNTVLDVSEAEWDRVFAVNVKGALLCAQFVAPGMMRRRAGKIVNVASAAGLHPGLGWAAYQTSKAAMIMLGRILAAELAPHNVQVNTVCPGAIRTPMTDYIRSVEGGDFPHASDPADIAQVVLGLVAPFEQTATGQVVGRDGKSVECERRSR